MQSFQNFEQHDWCSTAEQKKDLIRELLKKKRCAQMQDVNQRRKVDDSEHVAGWRPVHDGRDTARDPWLIKSTYG